ncbi:DNA-binding protein [Streptomyces sp. G9]|uniref:DNA-binding protein n=1 Tax=Streptomyces sp. G9 TaxID=1684483 RepID=UPI003D717AB3
MTEDDIATATGLPVHTWRRRHAAAFRTRVPVVNPGERLRLYDEEQAHAFMNGKHWPTGATTEAADDTQWPTAVPPGTEHPDDLLTDKETANVLGIRDATVRAYATTGYLPAGTERHGRTWWPRYTAEARRDADDQHHRTPGRKPGDPRNRAPRPRHDPRIAEIAELTTQAPLTTADVVQHYGVSERTAQRLLAAARTPAES